MAIQYLKKSNNNLAFNIALALQQFDYTRITQNNSKKKGQSFGFWWMGVAAALWSGVAARDKRQIQREKKAGKSFKPFFK